MRKQAFSWIVIVSFGLISFTLFALAAAGNLTAAPAGLPTAVTDGLYANHRSDGVINVATLGIFGPKICTVYGDPYSPLNSDWAPGPYTYTYRIRIPADYSSDIIRVELFDPDSINNALTAATVTHTQIAVAQGHPITETINCYAFVDQRDTCILHTGEITLTNATLDAVNPIWLVRVDENRGHGSNDGDGHCYEPRDYTPAYNTQTAYQLYYQANNGGGPQRVNLAAYTGQVNDGARDTGDHDTDLRWVSPGAPTSYDQPIAVPTDCGSPNGGDFDLAACPGGTLPGTGNGFEVSLAQDLTNIVVDPDSGARYLYLDVRTISGASGNGFAIWAGPPDYAAAIASDVNARNLQIVNNPGAHQSAGIDVFIDNYLPQNFLANFLVENRLLYLGPEYAGETILVSLFDSDSGSQPPVTFTFDSLAGTDWSLTFGIPGVDDPDGVPAGVRCTPGGCNNLWITPTYAITLPGDMSSCDWLNPDPTVCTPFYGGRFLGSYLDNSLLYASDTFGWQVTVPPPPAVDPLQGCSAFPIAIHDDVHSVTAVNGTNPYPDAADFAYPLAPPTYDSFVGNTPDIPLILAEEGDVFKLVGPGFSAGNYGWLLWNAGKPADANTLAASLTWPGDSLDYADHGDTGAPVGDFAHVVRGYVNSINDADVTLNLNNPVGASAANLGSAATQTAVNSHIDANRYLRLPLWDTAVPANNQYLISGFAIFRIIGYGATAGEDWLLLEFVRRDASCGQLEAVALESVAISGPTTGPVNATASFTATVNPISTTLPLTYTWEATGQTAVARAAASLADVVSFTWPVTGTQTITVSVSNAVGGPIIATHTFTVEMQTLYLPLMFQNWEAPAAWLEKP